MGPTAIISLLTYQTISHLDDQVEHAIVLTFMAGIVELVMGIFGLGKSFTTVYRLLIPFRLQNISIKSEFNM